MLQLCFSSFQSQECCLAKPDSYFSGQCVTDSQLNTLSFANISQFYVYEHGGDNCGYGSVKLLTDQGTYLHICTAFIPFSDPLTWVGSASSNYGCTLWGVHFNVTCFS